MARAQAMEHKPHGTLKELQDYSLDTGLYGSCYPSPESGRGPRKPGDPPAVVVRGKPGVLGCPWYDKCQFKAIRDCKDGMKGPENVVFNIRLESGVSNTFMGPCFDFYWSGLAKRWQRQAETGERIKFVGYAPKLLEQGVKILQKGTEVVHKTVDPTCAGCRRGECVLRKDVEKRVDPIVFPRIADSMPAAMNTIDRMSEADPQDIESTLHGPGIEIKEFIPEEEPFDLPGADDNRLDPPPTPRGKPK